jgi:hypothetical protein
MTPKEKAKDLVEKFKKYAYYPKTNDDEVFINQLNNNAKQCALIAVDEILWEIIKYADNSREYVVENANYWQEVKTEIINL